MDDTAPNDAQIQNWNTLAGPRWVAQQDVLDAQLEPLGIPAMEALGSLTGHRVLDVGGGCGATALALGDRVGPAGSVLAVDVSAVMLDRARERARGRANLAFLQADAQTAALGEEVFDAVYSRFGVMFFADPVAAFGNLRRALRVGGRLGFVCWQPLARNPWMSLPLAAVLPLVPAPPALVPPDAPGPFSFGEGDRVREVLARAGFADVTVVSHEPLIALGATSDFEATVDIALQLGPLASALRDAPPEVLSRAREAVRGVLASYQTPQGVRMRGATWVVTARKVS